MKVFSRFGTQPMKFTFTLEVHDVILPLIRGLNEGDLIHLSMERGSKACDGEEIQAGAISSIGDMKTEFNQSLSLGVTLFKDSKGKYQEKIGTLSLKQRKKGLQGKKTDKDSFKTIGVIPLEFHNLTERDGEEFSSSLMMGGRDGAFVNFKMTVVHGGVGDDDASSINSGMTPSSRSFSMLSGSKTKMTPVNAKKKNTKNKHDDDDEDDEDDENNEDEDNEWKPDFSKNSATKNTTKNAKNNKRDDEDEVGNPFDVANPFGDEFDDEDTKNKNKTKTKTGASTTGDKSKNVNSSNQNSSHHSRTKNQTVLDEENDEDDSANNLHKIDESKLSPEAKQWKKEYDELKAENLLLKEKENNLNLITQKAEFYCQESKRLEALLQVLKQEQEILISNKREIDAELKGRIAENEILVQEVISTKMSLVELSTELDVAKKNCSQLRSKLGLTANRLAGIEVNQVKQQQQQQQQSRNMNSDDNMKFQQQQQQQQRKQQPPQQQGNRQQTRN